VITRDQMLNQIITECEICKHLYTKIPADGFDYRPSPDQRSTLELLRYLSVCGVMGLRAMQAGDWTIGRTYSERASHMTPEEFPAAMDRQIEEIKEVFNSISDEEFLTKEAVYPTGQTMTFGQGAMKMSLQWLTAYKMQLFLYAKAAGATNIGTSNCWAGVDWKPKAAVAEKEAEAAEVQE
jgi:hypothetical protein